MRRRPGTEDASDTPVAATLDGSIVGSATLARLPGRRAHVGRIRTGLADSRTGRRIGAAPLDAPADIADNRPGLCRLELEVPADNEPALASCGRSGPGPEGSGRDAVFRAGACTDTLAMAGPRR